MTLLILGLILFLGVHSVSIVAPGWRDTMRARLGEGPWKGLYSLISIVGFAQRFFGGDQRGIHARSFGIRRDAEGYA